MSAKGKNKVNILMVDDQPAKLLSYEVILGELGENLIKATSGREALEQLLKNDIAIVLMDVSMPELDGFELAEMIHQHPRCQKTAVIFISAVHLTDLDQLKGYEHGAVDYISVPVIPELLRAKVSVFAELHRKTRQLETLNRELEQRVAERTEELEQRAETLQLLNSELARKNQDLDAIVKTAPDIIFSRQADGTRDYVSDRFYEYTGARPPAGRRFRLAAIMCIPTTGSAAWRSGCIAFSRARITNPSTACGAGTDSIAGFAPAPYPFEIRPARSPAGMGPAPTSMTANCWSSPCAKVQSNWRRWWMRGRLHCGAFPAV